MEIDIDIDPDTGAVAIRGGSYFGDCPRDDEGHCLPSGGGGSGGGSGGSQKPKPDKPKPGKPRSSASTHVAKPEEHAAAQKAAKKRTKNAPVPTAERVAYNRSKLDAWKAAVADARENGTKVPKQREYLDLRGNTKQRESRRKRLFAEFGGDDKGYVVCHGSGVKMHWTDDPKENTKGYQMFEEGKIFIAEQGGRYNLENLIPESPDFNRTRGNKPVRKENLK